MVVVAPGEPGVPVVWTWAMTEGVADMIAAASIPLKRIYLFALICDLKCSELSRGSNTRTPLMIFRPSLSLANWTLVVPKSRISHSARETLQSFLAKPVRIPELVAGIERDLPVRQQTNFNFAPNHLREETAGNAYRTNVLLC